MALWWQGASMSLRTPITLTCAGTSNAFGSAGRHCAAYLVDTAQGRFLLDAGPSVLSACKALGCDPDSIDGIAISHLHGDHFAGVPFLLLEYVYEKPRRRPLEILGPPETERRVFELYRAYYPEAGRKPLPFEVRFVELDEGGVHEIRDARFETFRVPHQESGTSLGMRLISGGRSLVYSGDTAWTPDLLRRSAGAGLFLCECSTFATPVPGHVRYSEIEANRSRFECDDLLLVHLGQEMRDRARQVAEAMASDGLVVQVGAPRRLARMVRRGG